MHVDPDATLESQWKLLSLLRLRSAVAPSPAGGRGWSVRDRAINPHGKIRMRCLFDETTAEHLARTPMSKYQTWRAIEGAGKVEACATVEDDMQLKRWLQSFGREVEGLGPEHLQREMAEESGRARGRMGADRYGTPWSTPSTTPNHIAQGRIDNCTTWSAQPDHDVVVREEPSCHRKRLTTARSQAMFITPATLLQQI
jgi:hypothetical protein